MRPRAIEVRIEELVLHGFSGADRLRIGAAVERELARLFTEGGVPEALARGGGREAVDAGSFVQRPLATPASLGGEVARALYGGIAR